MNELDQMLDFAWKHDKSALALFVVKNTSRMKGKIDRDFKLAFNHDDLLGTMNPRTGTCVRVPQTTVHPTIFYLIIHSRCRQDAMKALVEMKAELLKHSITKVAFRSSFFTGLIEDMFSSTTVDVECFGGCGSSERPLVGGKGEVEKRSRSRSPLRSAFE
jgi:hypothetical protein